MAKPPLADERVQLIKKAEISFDGGAHWKPCLRLQDHSPPLRVLPQTWLHRLELSEPFSPTDSSHVE